jgi:hypothetical protein
MWTPTIALLPGALIIYLGFDGGGYFPPATGIACAVLAVALVLRLTLAPRPLEGFGLGAALVTAALGLFAVWALVSTSWSDAPARAVADFNRVLLYMLMLALVASLPRSVETARLVLTGIAAGMTVVCIGGLLTRVLPETFPIATDVLEQRLSYPITYWNGIGLVTALAIVFATHFTCSPREHPVARVIAAAALPLLASTLYFTFSRASIAVAILGVLGYLALARPRGFLPAALAVLPTAAIGLVWSYDADLLAQTDPTTPAAADQGREVFLVLVLCALAAAAIRFALMRAGADSRLAAIEVAPRTRRLVALGVAGVLLFAAGTSWVAFDVGDSVARQYERFKEKDLMAPSEDARERLTEIGSNGRIDHWDVALDAWQREPLIGTGAGTYELTWAQHRELRFTVRDGHSLYLEALSELGLVGAALLLLALGGIVAVLAIRVRGPERVLWAAMLTGACVWAVHAAQDWVWELPAVTVWLFAAGGIALARPPTDRANRVVSPPQLARVVTALVILALAVTPILNALADAQVQASVRAFKRGDCATAIDHALSATSTLSARPEPYAILSFCDAQHGKYELAERMAGNAIDRDPGNWIYYYGRALVRAAGGADPRPDIAEARRLNPREPRAIEADEAFATDDPRKWRRRALKARLPIQ